MALRGQDQFPFILTSDGSMNAYPGNKTSAFRILLKEPIDVGDDDWEVCLLSINYPYSWTNVGPSAKVSMKYYIGGEKPVLQEVVFPDWQCQSMNEVIKFMTKDVYIGQRLGTETKVWLRLDELGRFKMTAVLPDFDVGFSDNMMRLLGLAGHERASDMSLTAFDQRQRHRHLISQIWMKDKQRFDYIDPINRQNVIACQNLMEFATLMSPYLHTAHLDSIHDRIMLVEEEEYAKSFDGIPQRIRNFTRRDLNTAPTSDDKVKLGDDFEHTNAGKVLSLLMYHMQSLCNAEDLPKTIKGITPGMINPVQRMFVYINIIEPLDMNDKTIKLLKLVNTRGEPFKTTQEEYTHPTYMALRKGKISMIDVLIADELGEPVSFQNGTVVLTLHFRRAAQGNTIVRRQVRSYH